MASFLALIPKEQFIKTFIKRFIAKNKTETLGKKQNQDVINPQRLKEIAEQTYDDMILLGQNLIENVGAVVSFDVSLNFKFSEEQGAEQQGGPQQPQQPGSDDLFGELDFGDFDINV
jgi:hypothetical protein